MTSKPIFRPLSADDPDPETTQIESLCMNCEDNGITRLLLTKIPFYKEVVIMSFHCDHCGNRNNEIQPGGKIEEKGIKIKFQVKTTADLNRQIIKSDYTSIKIPHLDFEIPSRSQKGEITTMEGIIDRSAEGLQQTVDTIRDTNLEDAEKLSLFIQKLLKLKCVDESFLIIIEDISGNSFVTNPNAPLKDKNVEITFFDRTKEQNHVLGLYEREEIEDGEGEREVGVMPKISAEEFTYENMSGEVLQFPTNCSNCNTPCTTNMKITNIPHFKEVVIMATNCEACGHRTNEVKSGGGIEPRGIKIEVKISKPEDFCRDVLKSDTCHLEIPEVGLEVGARALSGRFSTVEGILTGMKEQLIDSSGMFIDSQDEATRARFQSFLHQLDEILALKKSITLILDDPAGNSYVQKMSSDDPGLVIVQYDRTFEQNEELGLNDMKTENYEQGPSLC